MVNEMAVQNVQAATDKIVEVGNGLHINVSSLEEAIAGSLDQVMEYTQDAQGFVMEQAPLLCNEIINFAIARHAVLVMVSLVTGILFWRWGKKISMFMIAESKNTQSNFSTGDRQSIACIGIIVQYASLLTVIPIITNLFSIIKAFVAPRLFLIEYMAELIKSIS